MKLDEIAKKLAEYNEWRRGSETIDQPKPTELGKIIDEAVATLRNISNVLTGEEVAFEGETK